MDTEQEIETVTWPEGVPRTYDQLYKEYNEFIVRLVLRYNKVDRNSADLVQEIWAKLIGSAVLEKFVKASAKRLPMHMTALEAVAYLGVTWFQWEKAMQAGKRHGVWMPQPVEGGTYSTKAVFLTDEVMVLDEMGFFRKRANPRTAPKVSNSNFRSYLAQAVHNHFANFCRTRARKYQEHLLGPDVRMSANTDGSYRFRASEENSVSSWESSLVSAMHLDEEDMIDLVMQMKKADIDPRSQHGIEILDLMSTQGYTIQEAVKAHERAQIRVARKVSVTG